MAVVPTPSDRRALAAWWIVLAFVVVGAAVVRIWAAQDELWLDEIWSLMAFVRGAKSPLDTFSRHHDNNHYLVTLWMFVVGPRGDHWVWYRVPSLVAGVASVVLLARFANRWGRFESIAAAILSAASYPMIVYASEARGYALAGCFAVVSLLALDRFLTTRGWAASIVFCIATVLGFLSHLTFISCYAGAIAWSLLVIVPQPTDGRQKALDLLRCHAVPCAFVALLYWYDVRGIRIGGADEVYVMSDVLLRTAALTLGVVTTAQAFFALAALAAAAALSAALAGLWREKQSVWVFFLVSIVVAPVTLLLVKRPEALYERYFYVNIVLLLLPYSYLLGRILRSGRFGRFVAVALLAGVVAGNARLAWEFLQVGRGHYYDALQYMSQHSVEPDIQIASDGAFENGMYLGFYSNFLPPGRRLMFYERTAQLPAAPEWVLLHSRAQPYAPQSSIADLQRASRDRYVLVRVFPYAGLSGYHCALYHRADLEPGAAGP